MLDETARFLGRSFGDVANRVESAQDFAELAEVYQGCMAEVAPAHRALASLVSTEFRRRLDEGLFEEQSLSDAMPRSSEKEIVRTSVAWDPEEGKDVRKVVRIWIGDHPDISDADQRLRGAQEGARRILLDTLEILGK